MLGARPPRRPLEVPVRFPRNEPVDNEEPLVGFHNSLFFIELNQLGVLACFRQN